MSEIISLSEERERRRPQPVLCNKCSRRMILSDIVIAADGRRWKIYRCNPCKHTEWKSTVPSFDLN